MNRQGEKFRHEIGNRLVGARRETDHLFDFITPTGLYERPIPERQRMVFYLGHLDAFDWNLLCKQHRDGTCSSSRPEWEKMFAFGIDPLEGDQLPSDQPTDWPSASDLQAWLAELRHDVDRAVAIDPVEAPRDRAKMRTALEHRLMHAETLTYLINQLPLSCIDGPHPSAAPMTAPHNEWIHVPAGEVTLGLERARDPDLGWDNEYERHSVHVPGFLIQRYAVSNAEFLRFVGAGGYDDPRWWSEPDWQWRVQNGIERPVFWRRCEQGWMWRAPFGELPLPPAWPVYVSHAEASAYTRWKGAYLPSEAEWHRAAHGTPQGQQRLYPWGDEPPIPAQHGVFGGAFEPAPVHAHGAGQSGFGVYGMVGNGWQWTRTPFAPFEGFAARAFYPDYSSSFFDGKHYVMKGGAPRTDVTLLRPSFRNWFQGHYPYVHATFRCVRYGDAR